ncbi:unnamed protein product, partial [Discosporangium mesarthrocarpum]
VLKCICKTCSRVLLHESSRLTYLKRLRNPKVDNLARGAIHKKV